MNTPKRSVGRRLVAALGAAALSLVGVVGVVGAASAEPTTGNIDLTRNGSSSITVHKHAQQGEKGDPATGELQDGVLGKSLSGVEFSLYRLSNSDASPIDLTTNAGWAVAETVANAVGTPTVSGSAVTIGGSQYQIAKVGNTQQTVNGIATFSSLDFGIYLVIEGEDQGANGIVSPADPFVVTLPLPKAPNSWIYDVHTYPKNPTAGVTKTVDDANATKVGDRLKWSVVSEVPALTQSTPAFTQYVLNDDSLDPRLTLDTTSVKVVLKGSDGTEVSLTKGTDYTIASSVAGWTVTFNGPTGFAALASAPNGTVTVDFETVVKSVEPEGSDTTGTIDNNVTFTVNGRDYNASDSSDWGSLRIFKYTGNSKPLTGAEFTIYSDAAGTTEVTRVTVSDASGVAVQGLKAGKYWVKETKAPEGYTVDSTLHPVTITASNVLANPVKLDVPNTQKPAVELPLTGANGQLLALIGGGSLVLLAAGTALVARKRSHQD